ncbi:nuclear transport factor 2 family protein [Paraburkholderia sediminicola]|uniref:nuclear transport factor 2 family protein n=1 Tax=Paraburkholderia sediminicola TaxID=458836 RepID=UPI0038BAF482
MSLPENGSVEFALTLLLNRFFVYLDDRKYDELIRLFAANGVWHRQGVTLEGPAKILDALQARPADLTTRHLLTNVVPVVESADSVQAVMYITVFADNGPQQPSPLPMALPLQVGVYRARFVLIDEWRIAELRGDPTFRRADR